MWYKTIPEMLNYVKNLEDNSWIYLDTETTGLMGPSGDQLTQISAISVDPKTDEKISEFNQKIKLTDEIKTNLDDESNGWSKRKVLSFNHYGDKIEGKKYLEEIEVLEMFNQWVQEQNNPLFIIQNAEFDMNMLNGRNGRYFSDVEVLDTKMFLQLYIIPIYQKLAETDDVYKKKIERIGFSSRDGGLVSSSMAKWAPEFNIDDSMYHDALFDCVMMQEMFSKTLVLMKENEDLDIMKYQQERIKTL